MTEENEAVEVEENGILTPIEFESLDKIEVPVTLAGVAYVLIEADGAAITERDNSILSGMTMHDGKPIKMSGLASVDVVLLSRCLIHVKKGQKVPLSVIQAWPSRVRNALIDRLKAISGIVDSEEEQEDLEENLGN